MYCALLGQAGVFLYGQDKQVYFVWSGQAGVLFVLSG